MLSCYATFLFLPAGLATTWGMAEGDGVAVELFEERHSMSSMSTLLRVDATKGGDEITSDIGYGEAGNYE